jgi:thioesterase domain-containing protein
VDKALKIRLFCRAQLFCFHGVCGNAYNFKKLAIELSEYGIEVYSVQLPGNSAEENDFL